MRQLLKAANKKRKAYHHILKHKVKGKIIKLPIEKISNEFALSYGKNGWNHLVQILRDYDKNPGGSFEDSTFYQFFCRLRDQNIKTYTDILFFHDEEKRRKMPKLHFGIYAWGSSSSDPALAAGKPWGAYYDLRNNINTRLYHNFNIWHDVNDNHEEMQYEWETTIKLYKQIRSEGYKPFLYGKLPEVYLLKDSNNDYRAIRWNGQHRLAVLSHLGFKKIHVIVSENAAGVVSEENIDNWYHVKNGVLTKDQAMHFFRAYFEQTGYERVKKLF